MLKLLTENRVQMHIDVIDESSDEDSESPIETFFLKVDNDDSLQSASSDIEPRLF